MKYSFTRSKVKNASLSDYYSNIFSKNTIREESSFGGDIDPGADPDEDTFFYFFFFKICLKYFLILKISVFQKMTSSNVQNPKHIQVTFTVEESKVNLRN